MKVVVFGASGRTGREIVKQALAQQHEVTAFVRKPAEFDIRHELLQVIQGDITNYKEVEAALDGKDAAMSALGPHTLLKRIPELTTGLRNIVQAMEKKGVKRFVYESALGVGDSEADQNLFFRYVILPVLLSRDYADHEANEQTIRASKLDWVIVRPARLVDGPLTGNYKVDLRLSATFPFGMVVRADVAEFMLQQLTGNQFLHKTPGILGFRSL